MQPKKLRQKDQNSWLMAQVGIEWWLYSLMLTLALVHTRVLTEPVLGHKNTSLPWQPVGRSLQIDNQAWLSLSWDLRRTGTALLLKLKCLGSLSRMLLNWKFWLTRFQVGPGFCISTSLPATLLALVFEQQGVRAAIVLASGVRRNLCLGGISLRFGPWDLVLIQSNDCGK